MESIMTTAPFKIVSTDILHLEKRQLVWRNENHFLFCIIFNFTPFEIDFVTFRMLFIGEHDSVELLPMDRVPLEEVVCSSIEQAAWQKFERKPGALKDATTHESCQH